MMVDQLKPTKIRQLPCVRLTVDEHTQIVAEAARLGKSVSEVTRRAIALYMRVTEVVGER